MNAVKEGERSILYNYLDTATSIFLIINPDHTVELVNQKGCEILEYEKDEIIGKDWFENFILENDRKTLTKLFDEVVKGNVEAPQYFENWIIAKGEKLKQIQWHNSLLIDELGNVIGLVSSGIDITELDRGDQKLKKYTKNLEGKVKNGTRELQKTIKKLIETNVRLETQIRATEQAEIKYRESQALINAIAENFPNGVIAAFDEDFKVIYIEGEELKNLGLHKAEILGIRLDDMDFMSEEQKRKTKNAILRTLRGTSVTDDLEFREEIYSVNTTPLYSSKENRFTLALMVYINVTEQKKLQQQLERALLAERQLNELKSRFIAMASHEFKTPLSVILSSAILLEKYNEDGKKDQRLKHIERIRSNVNNLDVILNDFLSLDKMDEGMVTAVPKKFDLVQFINLVIKEIGPTKKLGQEITLQISESEIPVYLDPKLLSHIVMNLLSNAIKFSDEGQEVIVTLNRVQEEAIISITDEGMGISEEDQKHLFKRFFRSANALNIQGTGLGLHIVKHYMTLMGGDVGFKSVLDQGSTFTLKLPLKMRADEESIDH